MSDFEELKNKVENAGGPLSWTVSIETVMGRFTTATNATSEIHYRLIRNALARSLERIDNVILTLAEQRLKESLEARNEDKP